MINPQRHKHILSEEFIKQAINNLKQNEQCSQVHGGSCTMRAVDQFCSGFKSLYKIYLTAHLLQFLLFRRKKLKQNPSRELKLLISGFIKSMMFSAGYSMFGFIFHCLLIRYYEFSGWSYGLIAGMGGISLVFQPVGRQAQIALFTCKTAMETVHSQLKRRGWPVHIKNGQCLIAGIAFAVLCYHYGQNRQAFRQTYANLLDRLIGQSPE